MAEPLITTEELSNRLTKSTHVRVFNDNDTGEIDTASEEQLRMDASSKVRGALANTYDIEALSASNSIFKEELRRITLDVAHAMCGFRSPLVIKIDAFGLMKQAEGELQKLRDDKTSLESDVDDGSGDEEIVAAADDMPTEPTVEDCRAMPGLGNFYG